MTTRALIDANVIVQGWTIDLLLCMAEDELFAPAWSERILSEACQAICRVRACPAESARKVTQVMCAAFPDATVCGWEAAEKRFELPDPDDRHVAAAALVGDCDTLVTFNTRDFPPSAMAPAGIEVLDPDTFAMRMAQTDADVVRDAVRRAVRGKRQPPRTMDQELAGLRRNGLVRFADWLGSALD